MTISDASWPLQVAIVAALKADADFSALVGGRVHDNPPPGVVLPYVSYGPSESVTEIADEYEGSDETIQIDAWSNGPSRHEVKRIGRAIRAALHEQELSLNENQRLVSLDVIGVRYLTEPDGVTQHAAVSVRARTEPTV